MKIRSGFVSNSSSSSFVVDKASLKEDQIEAIHDHLEYAVEHDFTDCAMFKYIGRSRHRWELVETDDKICGHTTIDNFNMFRFLERIGVDLDIVIKEPEAYDIIRRIEDEQEEAYMNEIRARPLKETISIPFELHEEKEDEWEFKWYDGTCPVCNERRSLLSGNDYGIYLDPFHRYEDENIPIDELVRCPVCNAYFKLLEKDDDIQKWKWGVVDMDYNPEVEKIHHEDNIIERLGR